VCKLEIESKKIEEGEREREERDFEEFDSLSVFFC